MLDIWSETWTLRKQDDQRTQSAEIKFLRRINGCGWREQIRNEDVMAELIIYMVCE